MIVKYHKNFLRDIDKNKGNYILLSLKIVVSSIEKIKNINEIPGVKKLKGFKSIYRVRIGDYRMGFRFENNVIILDRFLHRKDIYKKYP